MYLLIVRQLIKGVVAWSNGQLRSLPLQGLRVRISAIPSIFVLVMAMILIGDKKFKVKSRLAVRHFLVHLVKKLNCSIFATLEQDNSQV